jgi:hypothetical protein
MSRNERLLRYMRQEHANVKLDLDRAKAAVKMLTAREKEIAKQIKDFEKEEKGSDADDATINE